MALAVMCTAVQNTYFPFLVIFLSLVLSVLKTVFNTTLVYVWGTAGIFIPARGDGGKILLINLSSRHLKIFDNFIYYFFGLHSEI
jgi:hypothetical protein